MSLPRQAIRPGDDAPRATCAGQRRNPLIDWKGPFMASFAFVYRNRPETYARLSPEDMQKQMQKWQAWIAEGFQKGWMVNPGDALTKEGRVVDAKKLVADGPFVEVK